MLGESIGDLAGAKIAYLGLQKSREGKAPGPTIDGFTPEQQFFIAWGQFRGDAIRPETQRADGAEATRTRPASTASSARSPTCPSSQQAFGCKPDAPMVRPAEKRCEVW